jgi:hypothetical protein
MWLELDELERRHRRAHDAGVTKPMLHHTDEMDVGPRGPVGRSVGDLRDEDFSIIFGHVDVAACAGIVLAL